MDYKVAICDDEAQFREQIRENLLLNDIEAIDEYSSGRSLLEQIRQGKRYDIIFMDVDMPDLRGTDAVAMIREFDKNIAICFATSFDEYAYQAFQLDAVGYIVKPVTKESIDVFLKKAYVWLSMWNQLKAADAQFLTVQVGHRAILADMDDILYIEKQGNASVIHMKDEELVCYETLKNLDARLDHAWFAYIHQGYIVNFMHVKEVKNSMAYLGKGIELPISRKHIRDAKQRMTEKITLYRKKMQDHS